jgi:hypothetical protein
MVVVSAVAALISSQQPTVLIPLSRREFCCISASGLSRTGQASRASGKKLRLAVEPPDLGRATLVGSRVISDLP